MNQLHLMAAIVLCAIAAHGAEPPAMIQDQIAGMLETAEALDRTVMICKGRYIIEPYDGPVLLDPNDAKEKPRQSEVKIVCAWHGQTTYQSLWAFDRTWEWLQEGSAARWRCDDFEPDQWHIKPPGQTVREFRRKHDWWIQSPDFQYGDSFFGEPFAGCQDHEEIKRLPIGVPHSVDRIDKAPPHLWNAYYRDQSISVVCDSRIGFRPVVIARFTPPLFDPGYPHVEYLRLKWGPDQRRGMLPTAMKYRMCDGQSVTVTYDLSVRWLDIDRIDTSRVRELWRQFK